MVDPWIEKALRIERETNLLAQATSDSVGLRSRDPAAGVDIFSEVFDKT